MTSIAALTEKKITHERRARAAAAKLTQAVREIQIRAITEIGKATTSLLKRGDVPTAEAILQEASIKVRSADVRTMIENLLGIHENAEKVTEVQHVRASDEASEFDPIRNRASAKVSGGTVEGMDETKRDRHRQADGIPSLIVEEEVPAIALSRNASEENVAHSAPPSTNGPSSPIFLPEPASGRTTNPPFSPRDLGASGVTSHT
ncbi:hypothetical protein [Jiella avicenniae]|uniref:Uncharacterized protein n=1 Tax=Jiella avicenniae TaxID=2907202 RepID=A0A9X1P1F5_9HYPH|nr:hypothetical protein [Jiella avicenniae]MCE7028094.1 hypothetical protein [Jiella avicenniae]